MHRSNHRPPPEGDWLAVSTEGFAAMNAGRDPAHLVKELLQNALDALGDDGGQVILTAVPGAQRDTVVVTCRDNGCGMENLRDIRTVFYTSKTDSHLKRGRMAGASRRCSAWPTRRPSRAASGASASSSSRAGA